jgi:hypothetical protein
MKDTQEKDIASADYLDYMSNSCQSKLYSSEKDQPKQKKGCTKITKSNSNIREGLSQNIELQALFFCNFFTCPLIIEDFD